MCLTPCNKTSPPFRACSINTKTRHTLAKSLFPRHNFLLHFQKTHCIFIFAIMNLKTRALSLALTIVALFSFHVQAQRFNSATPSHTYYYDYKLANPAFTGTRGKHVITTLVNTVTSSVAGKPQLTYASYERNIEAIQSGIGGLIIYEEFGPYKFTQFGALFRKQVSFTEASGLYLGTQLSYQRGKFDYGAFNPIDGDPVSLEGETKQRNFNIDLGAVYYSSAVTVGASVKNLLEQEQSIIYQKGSLRSINLIVTRDFQLTEQVKLTPSVLFNTFSEENDFYINNTFTFKKWVMLGASYQFGKSNEDNFDVNLGLNIKGWVQIVSHVYSSANYRLRNYTGTTFELMVRAIVPNDSKSE